MQGEQQSVNGDWVEQSDVRQGRPYVLITAAAEQVCLGSAVEIFATCLETTVCRRGDAAAFSPMVDGRDSRDGDRSEGSSDSRAAGRLLPVEVLQAVRLANNIEEGTENIPKCWAVGRNVVGDTTKRVDTLGDMCDIRSICDHWEVRRGTPKSGDTRKWRSSMFTSRTNFDEKDKIRRQESCQFKIPRRLWGFDGDGQSVKEVAAFGKRDSEVRLVV